VLITTDTRLSNDEVPTHAAASQPLKQQGINIFVLATNHQTKPEHLKDLASHPANIYTVPHGGFQMSTALLPVSANLGVVFKGYIVDPRRVTGKSQISIIV